MQFELKNKTGFFAVSDKIEILDSSGNPFYFFDFTGRKKRRRFNLPGGKFTLKEGKINRLNKPVYWPLKELPRAEFLFRRYPEKWLILFGNNPNKCTVDYSKGIMLFDKQYKTAPRLVFDYILNHELGHRKYKNEKYADAFSCNRMLLKGYNPSQIRLAPAITLSDRSQDRKEYIFKHFNYENI